MSTEGQLTQVTDNNRWQLYILVGHLSELYCPETSQGYFESLSLLKLMTTSLNNMQEASQMSSRTFRVKCLAQEHNQ